MNLIGLSVYHADCSAAAVRDGHFIAGVEEERFCRIKHWAGFPEKALRWCLEELVGTETGAVEAVAVARDPRRYLGRKLWVALSHPRSLPRALGRARNLLEIERLEQRLEHTLGCRVPVVSVEHHLAHLASAFFCSPFEEAALLSVDGFGDFVSTMLAVGRGNAITPISRVHFPHSLGVFYTALTQFLGFSGFGDEYKVMGLAAYGKPSFKRQLEELVPIRSDGSFILNLRYFLHLAQGVEMTWEDEMPRLGQLFSPRLEKLLGPARQADQPISEREQDIAASLQAVYEDRFFSLVRALVARTGLKRLALAGGCALNSVANGKLFDTTPVEEVFIQPAAGDGGTSLGAALYAHHHHFGRKRSNFVLEHAAWGPGYREEEVRRALRDRLPESGGGNGRFRWQRETLELKWFEEESRLVEETAHALVRGEVVGWFQGRSEWGPRALGQRSILADPRRPDMKELLNRKIKRRESFRPFAPSILEEHTGEWFECDAPDPFMLKVYPIRPEKRSLIPAVAHVDGSGRLQTVSEHATPLYYRLIRAFAARTGVPMLLNTSFNENEPIVNRPEEALDCFLRTGMDRLVLGRAVLLRVRQEGSKQKET